VLQMPPSADPAAIAKAREAVREKMSQLEPEQPATTTVAPTVAAPTTGQSVPRPVEPVVSQPTPATSQPPAVAAVPNQTDTRVDAEAAAQLEAGKNPKSKPAKTKAEKVKPTPPPKGPLAFPALEGPPSPLSAAKQQKLKDLLRLYQADQVTPEQYHQQRAKILAEP
jgi:hypothetical protein